MIELNRGMQDEQYPDSVWANQPHYDIDGKICMFERLVMCQGVIIARLRAVKTGDGTWIPVVRDATGEILATDGRFKYKGEMEALDMAMRMFRSILIEDMERFKTDLFEEGR